MTVLSSFPALVRRRSRRAKPGLETLEGRALLSHAGPSLAAAAPAAHVERSVTSQSIAVALPSDVQQLLTDAISTTTTGRAPRFYERYRGQKRPMLHVLTARGQFFPPQGFVLTGVTVGSINTSLPAFYVFGINRGGATAPGPLPGRPNITFDARVIVATNPNGVGAEVQILNSAGSVTKTVALPLAAIEFSKNHVGVFVPANLLPSTSPAGTANPVQNYSFTFWAGSWPTIPARIAGFYPPFQNAPFELKTQPPSMS
jgi:hypothetical protein